MIRCKKDNVEWLEFEQLQEFPEIIHGVFLRHGGVSEAPYTSLNCGGGCGDANEIIDENRRIVREILGIKKLISSKQVHGDQVLAVPAEPADLECDGLVTSEADVGLLIKHADCQAAIFYDPIRKVIANVHCGWRGSVANIYAKTIEHLVRRFHCKAADLIVCISPSLGPEKAEFINHRFELPPAFYPFQIRENYFDFWEISKMQLRSCGVLDQHIEVAGLCTYAGENDFFSHRREKKTGRHGTVVALKR